MPDLKALNIQGNMITELQNMSGWDWTRSYVVSGSDGKNFINGCNFFLDLGEVTVIERFKSFKIGYNKLTFKD